MTRVTDQRISGVTEQRAKSPRGITVGSLFGISIVLDWSLLIIALLIATTVSMGPLTQWHTEWSTALRWLIGAGAAILLFTSVLIHEFSHALMARRYGTVIKRITLFIFGGMAHIEEEPKHWRAELMIAGVGPVTSILLGFILILAAGLLVDPAVLAATTAEQLFSNLTPLTTLLLWAGNVNIVLAIFNLVPAFPLDGGRMLRAVLWRITGKFVEATRWAANGGRVFGWLLSATGIAMILGIPAPFFGSGLISGIWLIFIGWFLARIAMLSYQEADLKDSLAQVKVGQIMRRDFATVAPEYNLEEVVENFILPRGQRGYPVLDKDELIGMISFDDVRRVPRERWQQTRVVEIMTGKDGLLTLQEDDDSFAALSQLSSREINQMPVLRNEQVVGLLQREDVLRWLELFTRPSPS